MEAGAELVGIEAPEYPTERVVARRTILQLEETAEEFLLCPAKDVHIHRGLATTQNRTQSDHQDLKQIMASGVTRPRVFKTFKAGCKRFHPIPIRDASTHHG